MDSKNTGRPGALQQAVGSASTELRNSATVLLNTLARVRPGERPGWLLLELSGSFPVRRHKRRLMSTDTLLGKERQQSQEELAALVTALIAAEWLKGVVVRFCELELDWASAYAVRRQLQRLKTAGKGVVATATNLGNADYYVASVADEIVMPESGELGVTGTAFSTTYRADFLKRFGVKVEKVAIREYKSAMDDMVRSEMSEGQREQLDAILDSLQRTFAAQIAADRGREPGDVLRWVDDGITSATGAADAGMIDRVAYEDEILGKEHKSLAAGARFLIRPLRPASPKRIAFVSLEGAIVPGKSRQFPLPIPLLGGRMAGSETLVRALRTAGKDPRTAAVVFHVDSGGGSALASDLIWREVQLLAKRMPVVAVMGAVAGSGGYYVLTHATRVIAAPTTITGSIGVLTAKLVLSEFNRMYGFNPETLKRGRFADLHGSSRGWDSDEHAHVERYINEVYDRFVNRVAEGRGLSPERVNEIGRGRIWSGEDALGIGLVDELGDAARAIELAAELAGLERGAPVWTVAAPQKYVLPVGEDAEAVQRALLPLLRERACLVVSGLV